MITAKRFENGTVVKADKWSQVQFFSAGKKLDIKGSRGLLKASPAEIAEHLPLRLSSGMSSSR